METRYVACGVALIVLAGCVGERPEPERQMGDPGAFAAEAIAPGVISTDEGESWISFHPTMDLAVLGRHNENWGEHTLYWTQLVDGEWSAPAVITFSGTFNDRGARFSPDGRYLYFSSDRPRPGSSEQGSFNIWRAPLSEEGWADLEYHPDISSDEADYHPSVATDGTIYFASRRDGGAGRSDIYRAVPVPGGYRVEALGPPINTERSEADVFVDPEQRFIIFVRTDDPAGYGGDDLYYSELTADGWSPPRNLGDAVNTPEYEYGPLLSWDGSRLYFTSHAPGQADLFEIAASEVGIRPQ